MEWTVLLAAWGLMALVGALPLGAGELEAALVVLVFSGALLALAIAIGWGTWASLPPDQAGPGRWWLAVPAVLAFLSWLQVTAQVTWLLTLVRC